MKRYVCPMAVMLLAICAVPNSILLGTPALLINCVPTMAWSLVLMLCHSRLVVLRDYKAIFFGLLYGACSAVACAAAVNLISVMAFSNAHTRHPYDSTACGILLIVATFGLLTVALLDYIKHCVKPIWPRIVTALVTVAPATLLSLWVMEFFEGILSRYVS